MTNSGETLIVNSTTPVNSTDDGKINGFEIGYQQTYDFLPGFWGGFGLQANFTHVDSSGVKQSLLSSTDSNIAADRVQVIDTSKLPLQGLSENSYNITPFYQSGPFEARIAYTWRSEYLVTPRDVIVPYHPMMQEAFGTLDASVFYSISKNLKIGLQGANLNNAITKTRAVISQDFKEAPRSFYVSDRRYTLGLRWTFE